MELNEIIGRKVKHLRKKRDLTQEDLAEKANLHPTFIARIERGNRICSIHTLRDISAALDVQITELLSPADRPAIAYSDKLLDKIVDMVKDSTDDEKRYIIDMVELTLVKHKRAISRK